MAKKIETKKVLDEKQFGNTKMRNRLTLEILGVLIVYAVLAVILVAILLVLGVSLSELSTPWTLLILLTLLCLFLSTVAAYYLMKKIFNPLQQISVAAGKVASGDFTAEISYQGEFEELERTFENFNRMVKELNSVEIMRNDFIADVSHEFKTPLSAISGYATLLQDSELTEEEKTEYIRKIFFHIDKLNDLTENILRLSKMEQQQFLESPVTFRLDEQLREVIVLLEPKWSEKNLELDLELPEIQFTGHPSLLFTVWTNLIGNAIKYTDAGGTIGVLLSGDKESVRITVRDNGIGMDEETKTHIFDKFYQGDTSRKSQGNGLGLAICKEIIRKCEGEITVISAPGEGSEFVVTLKKGKGAAVLEL
ncbi:MAG: HAMP domain-containing histidine kinase [Lachnospiraceae bacterium]|nr:HAMP domain-containing histidine kinase [Lachnospiraceae bacterium]